MRNIITVLGLSGLLLVAGCQKDETPPEHYSPPGSRYDLSHWKLTLPDDNATEIGPPELSSYASRYFHLTSDGAMAFVATVGGGTTKNSHYPRSELRELLDPKDDNHNWNGDGHHVLRATTQVVKTPDEQKVIVGQIHGFDARPLVKLLWKKGQLVAQFKKSPKGSNEEVDYTFAKKVGNNPFSYVIEVRDGVIKVTVEGESTEQNFYQSDAAWHKVVFYFKAGAYVQSDKKSNGQSAEVRFTQLSVEHGS